MTTNGGTYIREAGAFILKVTYGYSILPEEIDPLVTLSESALEWFVYSTAPGKWLVDSLPFSEYPASCRGGHANAKPSV
jgi:hypothetical protein